MKFETGLQERKYVMREARDITIKGIVQGVGFRPFVYRCAHEFGIKGWVLNGTFGVKVHAEGTPANVDAFIMSVHDNAPAAAHIAEMEIFDAVLEPCDDFKIVASVQSAEDATTLVSADLATCAACEQELFDPSNRRYRYPFINCTNCGPRFTIIDKLPYDRCNTSMGSFEMCPSCAEEYADPLNRRFHAQPDACWSCGPVLSWTQNGNTLWGETREESDVLLAWAVQLLLQGGILAVKGLGGFHLVCNADDAQAVATLRKRKRREGKPFAVMMQTVESVRELCHVSENEAQLLSGSVRPIVLLRLKAQVRITPGLADNLYELGVMLPYTPLQMLLMHDFAAAGGRMLVMTSGNVHDEPIVTSDEQALQALGSIADALLGNNREIRARYDDSVVRVLDFEQAGSALQFVRRARGYAPTPLQVNEAFKAPSDVCVCATGPEQKTTACFLRGNEAFITQHIGDMENALTNNAWFETLEHYQRLFRLTPTLLACDKHPEYLTTKWAREQPLFRVEVQHHHAHIVSALAENGLEGPALGFAFDGTGYGPDAAIWGGEALLCNTTTFERFGNFAYGPMPGGTAAVKNPLRMAYGVLWAYDLLEHPAAKAALEPLGTTVQLFERMIESGLNTPYTSSAGRLFDAAAALLGICVNPAYEGEGAVLLEAAAACAAERALHEEASSAELRDSTEERDFAELGDSTEEGDFAELRSEASQPSLHSAESLSQTTGDVSQLSLHSAESLVHTTDDVVDACDQRYRIEIQKNVATENSTAQDTSVLLFDAAPVFAALLDDVQAGVSAQDIALRFHKAFVELIVNAAQVFRALYGISTVALSGGVFLNRYLTEHVVPALVNQGFTVALNKEVPPGDGCISLGQAVIACATSKQSTQGEQRRSCQ